MKNIYPIFFLLFFLSCQGNSNRIDYSEINLEKAFELTENISPIGNPLSYDFSSLGDVFITSANPSEIWRFDAKGNQMNRVGQNGGGPMEFVDPSIVKVIDDKVFVWCRMQLKLLAFDFLGKPIAEYKFAERAVEDFQISGSKAIMYFRGGSKESIIQIYDLKTLELLNEFGAPSNEHLMLSTNDCSGGVQLIDGSLVYSFADKLDLYLYDFESSPKQYSVMNDPDFVVSKMDQDPVEFINADFNNLINYTSKNSLLKGLFQIDDKLVSVAEIGEFSFYDDGKVNNSQRFITFYAFDSNLKLVRASKMNHDFNLRTCLIRSNGKELMVLTTEKDGNDFKYVFKVLKGIK